MRLNVGRCTCEFPKYASPVNPVPTLPLPCRPPPSAQSHGVAYGQMIQKKTFKPVLQIAQHYRLTADGSRFMHRSSSTHLTLKGIGDK